MTGVYEVPKILWEGDFAVKIDLENGKLIISHRIFSFEMLLAFFHVPIHPDHWKYLTFVWNGHVYQFRVLCFGIRNAPFTFHTLGGAVRDFLSCLGVTMIIYLDDILVLAQTFEQCIKHAQLVVDTRKSAFLHLVKTSSS